MGMVRMQSWRKHPAISGAEPENEPAPKQALQLPDRGRFGVSSFAGRFLVIDHTGNAASTMKVTRRDAEELADKLNLNAEREERFGSTRRRPCLSCAREFMSEGIHNRLCSYCAELGHSPSRW